MGDDIKKKKADFSIRTFQLFFFTFCLFLSQTTKKINFSGGDRILLSRLL